MLEKVIELIQRFDVWGPWWDGSLDGRFLGTNDRGVSALFYMGRHKRLENQIIKPLMNSDEGVAAGELLVFF